MFRKEKNILSFLKLSAWLTLVSFTFSSVSWDQPAAAQVPEPWSVQIPELITVPENLGSVEIQFPGTPGKPFVIHIQDAHAVVDAQDNIQNLIRYFQETYGINLVALEGGSGKLDATLFRAFPDAFIKTKVMREYFERGELSGPAMASILNPEAASYHGIEDWNLYEENYLAYLQAVREKDALHQKILETKKSLDRESDKVFSPGLKTFHRHTDAFYGETENFSGFLSYLKTAAPKRLLEKYPQLLTLIQSAGEADPKSQALAESSIRKLAETFKKNHLSQLSKNERMEFEKSNQFYQTGQIDPGQMLDTLTRFGKKAGVNPKLTPVMKNLLSARRTLESLKGTKVFEELEALLTEVEAGLTLTDEEKRIMLGYKRLRFLKDLAGLEVSRTQLDEYQRNPEAHLTLLGSERSAMYPALEFYRLVLERDAGLYSNLEKLIEENHASGAVVITGGFHAKGFEERMKAAGYSYALVTPKMSSLKGHENYSGLMLGKVSYLQELREDFYDAFVKHASGRLMQEEKGNELRGLKLWRDDVIRQLAREGRLSEAGKYTRYIDALTKSRSAAAVPGSREEILKAVNEAVDRFRDKTVDSLWERFEFQFQTFTQGVSDLILRKQINVENVQKLMDATGGAEKPALIQMTAVLPLSPGRRLDSPELRDFFFSRKYPAARTASPELGLTVTTPAKLDEALRGSEKAPGWLVGAPAVVDAARTLDRVTKISGTDGMRNPPPVSQTRQEMQSLVSGVADRLSPAQRSELRAQGAEKLIAAAILENLENPRQPEQGREISAPVLFNHGDKIPSLVRGAIAQEINWKALSKNHTNVKVLEMGIGSGVLTQVLKEALRKNVPADFTGFDINAEAIRSSRNLLGSEFDARASDLFSAANPGEKWDVIFWNPPWYSDTSDGALALAKSDPDFKTLREFLKQAGDYLNPEGKIFLILPEASMQGIWDEAKAKYEIERVDGYEVKGRYRVGLYQLSIPAFLQGAPVSAVPEKQVSDARSELRSSGVPGNENQLNHQFTPPEGDIKTLELTPDVVEKLIPQLPLAFKAMQDAGLDVRAFGGAVRGLAFATQFNYALPISEIDLGIPMKDLDFSWLDDFMAAEENYLKLVASYEREKGKPLKSLFLHPTDEVSLSLILQQNEWSISKFWLEYDKDLKKFFLKGDASWIRDLKSKKMRIVGDYFSEPERIPRMLNLALELVRFGFTIDEETLRKFDDEIHKSAYGEGKLLQVRKEAGETLEHLRQSMKLIADHPKEDVLLPAPPSQDHVSRLLEWVFTPASEQEKRKLQKLHQDLLVSKNALADSEFTFKNEGTHFVSFFHQGVDWALKVPKKTGSITPIYRDLSHGQEIGGNIFSPYTTISREALVAQGIALPEDHDFDLSKDVVIQKLAFTLEDHFYFLKNQWDEAKSALDSQKLSAVEKDLELLIREWKRLTYRSWAMGIILSDHTFDNSGVTSLGEVLQLGVPFDESWMSFFDGATSIADLINNVNRKWLSELYDKETVRRIYGEGLDRDDFDLLWPVHSTHPLDSLPVAADRKRPIFEGAGADNARAEFLKSVTESEKRNGGAEEGGRSELRNQLPPNMSAATHQGDRSYQEDGLIANRRVETKVANGTGILNVVLDGHGINPGDGGAAMEFVRGRLEQGLFEEMLFAAGGNFEQAVNALTLRLHDEMRQKRANDIQEGTKEVAKHADEIQNKLNKYAKLVEDLPMKDKMLTIKRMEYEKKYLPKDRWGGGTTLTLVYVPDAEKKAYVAVLGDSPVVIRRAGAGGKIWNSPVHNVHQNAAEAFNVEDRDGVTIEGSYVKFKGQNIQITGSIGDFHFDDIFARTPFTDAIDLDDESFIALATDGVEILDYGGELQQRSLDPYVGKSPIQFLEEGAGADWLVGPAIFERMPDGSFRVKSGSDNATAIVWRPYLKEPAAEAPQAEAQQTIPLEDQSSTSKPSEAGRSELRAGMEPPAGKEAFVTTSAGEFFVELMRSSKSNFMGGAILNAGALTLHGALPYLPEFMVIQWLPLILSGIGVSAFLYPLVIFIHEMGHAAVLRLFGKRQIKYGIGESSMYVVQDLELSAKKIMVFSIAGPAAGALASGLVMAASYFLGGWGNAFFIAGLFTFAGNFLGSLLYFEKASPSDSKRIFDQSKEILRGNPMTASALEKTLRGLKEGDKIRIVYRDYAERTLPKNRQNLHTAGGIYENYGMMKIAPGKKFQIWYREEESGERKSLAYTTQSRFTEVEIMNVEKIAARSELRSQPAEELPDEEEVPDIPAVEQSFTSLEEDVRRTVKHRQITAAVEKLWDRQDFNRFKELVLEYQDVPGMGILLQRISKEDVSRAKGGLAEMMGELFAADYVARSVKGAKIVALNFYLGNREIDAAFIVDPSEVKPDQKLDLEPGLYLVEAKESDGFNFKSYIEFTVKNQLVPQLSRAGTLREIGIPVKGELVVIGGKESEQSPEYGRLIPATLPATPKFSDLNASSLVMESFDVKNAESLRGPPAKPDANLIRSWDEQSMEIQSVIRYFSAPLGIMIDPALIDAEVLKNLQQPPRDYYPEKEIAAKELKARMGELEKRANEVSGWEDTFVDKNVKVPSAKVLSDALTWYWNRDGVTRGQLRSQLHQRILQSLQHAANYVISEYYKNRPSFEVENSEAAAVELIAEWRNIRSDKELGEIWLAEQASQGFYLYDASYNTGFKNGEKYYAAIAQGLNLPEGFQRYISDLTAQNVGYTQDGIAMIYKEGDRTSEHVSFLYPDPDANTARIHDSISGKIYKNQFSHSGPRRHFFYNSAVPYIFGRLGGSLTVEENGNKTDYTASPFTRAVLSNIGGGKDTPLYHMARRWFAPVRVPAGTSALTQNNAYFKVTINYPVSRSSVRSELRTKEDYKQLFTEIFSEFESLEDRDGEGESEKSLREKLDGVFEAWTVKDLGNAFDAIKELTVESFSRFKAAQKNPDLARENSQKILVSPEKALMLRKFFNAMRRQEIGSFLDNLPMNAENKVLRERILEKYQTMLDALMGMIAASPEAMDKLQEEFNQRFHSQMEGFNALDDEFNPVWHKALLDPNLRYEAGGVLEDAFTLATSVNFSQIDWFFETIADLGYVSELDQFVWNPKFGLREQLPRRASFLGGFLNISAAMDPSYASIPSVKEMVNRYRDALRGKDTVRKHLATAFFEQYYQKGLTDSEEMINDLEKIILGDFDNELKISALYALRVNTFSIPSERLIKLEKELPWAIKMKAGKDAKNKLWEVLAERLSLPKPMRRRASENRFFLNAAQIIESELGDVRREMKKSPWLSVEKAIQSTEVFEFPFLDTLSEIVSLGQMLGRDLTLEDAKEIRSEAARRVLENRSELRALETEADFEQFSLYPAALIHSPELFDRLKSQAPEDFKKYYTYDAAHFEFKNGFWESKDFPGLVLGTWQDVREAMPGMNHQAMKKRVVTHFKIPSGQVLSAYSFDDHGLSAPLFMESVARGELGKTGNTHVFLDEHFDASTFSAKIPEPDPTAVAGWMELYKRQDVRMNNFVTALGKIPGFIKGHFWIFDNTNYVSEPSRGPKGSEVFIEGKPKVENVATWAGSVSGYFGKKGESDRPKNVSQNLALNIDTDVTGDGDGQSKLPEPKDRAKTLKFYTDFLLNLAYTDGTLPSVIHNTTTAFSGATYGYVGLVQFLQRIAPIVFLAAASGVPREKTQEIINNIAHEYEAFDSRRSDTSWGSASRSELPPDPTDLETARDSASTPRSELRSPEADGGEISFRFLNPVEGALNPLTAEEQAGVYEKLREWGMEVPVMFSGNALMAFRGENLVGVQALQLNLKSKYAFAGGIHVDPKARNANVATALRDATMQFLRESEISIFNVGIESTEVAQGFNKAWAKRLPPSAIISKIESRENPDTWLSVTVNPQHYPSAKLIFEKYFPGEFLRAVLLERGLAKPRVWRIETKGGKEFVLAEHRLRNKPKLIEWEASLLNQLRRNGFRLAPEIQATRAGKPYVRDRELNKTLNIDKGSGDYFVLYEKMPGQRIPWGEIRGNKLEQAARVQALYHNAAAGVTPAGRNIEESNRLYPLANISDILPMAMWFHKARADLPGVIAESHLFAPALKAFIENYEIFLTHLNKIPQNVPSGLPELTLHGDFNPNNLLFDGENISGVIDFDYSRLAPRIVDLANGTVDLDFSQSPVDFSKLVASLEEYQETVDQKLSREELAALREVYRAYILEGVSLRIYLMLYHLNNPVTKAQKERAELYPALFEKAVKSLDALDRMDWEKEVVDRAAADSKVVDLSEEASVVDGLIRNKEAAVKTSEGEIFGLQYFANRKSDDSGEVPASPEYFRIEIYQGDRIAGHVDVQIKEERGGPYALIDYAFSPNPSLTQKASRFERGSSYAAITTFSPFQSQYRGIGTTLMGLAMRVAARDFGAERLDVQSVAKNAVEFYEKLKNASTFQYPKDSEGGFRTDQETGYRWNLNGPLPALNIARKSAGDQFSPESLKPEAKGPEVRSELRVQIPSGIGREIARDENAGVILEVAEYFSKPNEKTPEIFKSMHRLHRLSFGDGSFRDDQLMLEFLQRNKKEIWLLAGEAENGTRPLYGFLVGSRDRSGARLNMLGVDRSAQRTGRGGFLFETYLNRLLENPGIRKVGWNIITRGSREFYENKLRELKLEKFNTSLGNSDFEINLAQIRASRSELRSADLPYQDLDQFLDQKEISRDEFTTLVYPASGNHDGYLMARYARLFENLNEFHLISQSYSSKVYGKKLGKEAAKGFVEQLARETGFRVEWRHHYDDDVEPSVEERILNPNAGRTLRVRTYGHDYKEAALKFDSPGRRIWIDKGPGENARLRDDLQWYQGTLERGIVRARDLVLTVPAPYRGEYSFGWKEQLTGDDVRLVIPGDYHKWAWVAFQVTDKEDFRGVGKSRSELRAGASAEDWMKYKNGDADPMIEDILEKQLGIPSKNKKIRTIKILDIGAGDGEFIKNIHQQLTVMGYLVEVTGVERKNVPGAPPIPGFFNAEISFEGEIKGLGKDSGLKIEPGSFDLIFMNAPTMQRQSHVFPYSFKPWLAAFSRYAKEDAVGVFRHHAGLRGGLELLAEQEAATAPAEINAYPGLHAHYFNYPDYGPRFAQGSTPLTDPVLISKSKFKEKFSRNQKEEQRSEIDDLPSRSELRQPDEPFDYSSFIFGSSDESTHVSIFNSVIQLMDQNESLKERGITTEKFLTGEIINVGVESVPLKNQINPNNLVSHLRPSQVNIIGVSPLIKNEDPVFNEKSGYRNGTAQKLSSVFEENSLDGAVSFGLFNPEFFDTAQFQRQGIKSLEGFYEMSAAEISKVLKPEGVLLVSIGIHEPSSSEAEAFKTMFGKRFEVIALGEDNLGVFLMINKKKEARSELRLFLPMNAEAFSKDTQTAGYVRRWRQTAIQNRSRFVGAFGEFKRAFGNFSQNDFSNRKKVQSLAENSLKELGQFVRPGDLTDAVMAVTTVYAAGENAGLESLGVSPENLAAARRMLDHLEDIPGIYQANFGVALKPGSNNLVVPADLLMAFGDVAARSQLRETLMKEYHRIGVAYQIGANERDVLELIGPASERISGIPYGGQANKKLEQIKMTRSGEVPQVWLVKDTPVQFSRDAAQKELLRQQGFELRKELIERLAHELKFSFAQTAALLKLYLQSDRLKATLQDSSNFTFPELTVSSLKAGIEMLAAMWKSEAAARLRIESAA